MLSRKLLARASLSTIVCGLAVSAAAQDTLKSSKFLEYPAESQKSFITSSAMMAGVIATQNAPDQAKCIGEWATTKFEVGHKAVVEAMRRFPDHHPTTVIFAVLQKACGTFAYRN